jgi:protease I
VGLAQKQQQNLYHRALNEENEMKLGTKTVAVLVEDLYEDLELWYPVYRLREEGARVVLVGPEAGKTYASKHGYPAKADRAAKDVVAGDYDAIIIPGGYAPDLMRRDPAMVKLVADAVEQGKTVAAICHGPWMLCSAGVLRGRCATSFFSIKDDLAHAGAEWVDHEVVRDQNLITSRRPDDLPAFLRAVVESLSETPIAV